MKKPYKFVLSKLVAGMLIVLPLYLAVLLLVKAISSLTRLVNPLTRLVPSSMQGGQTLSVCLVLILCFLIGLAVQTSLGRAVWKQIDNSLFQKIPGYSLIQDLTQRVTGKSESEAWKPALVDMAGALVPAFIIEELDDGRSTVFIPSVPTPLAGAVYVLPPERVYPLNVSFVQAFKTVSHWGSGSKALVAAMESKPFRRAA